MSGAGGTPQIPPMTHRIALISALLAASLLAAPARAGQGDARLDPLFRDLLATADGAVAGAVEDRIWEIWLEHPGEEVLALMRAGVQNLNDDRAAAALAAFDAVVDRDPAYAEGWNKRANANYLLGRYGAAVQDIRRVLLLEPRHFAALAGLGLVYLALDEPAGALRAFDAALAINPHLEGVRAQAARLRQRMAGPAL